MENEIDRQAAIEAELISRCQTDRVDDISHILKH